MQSIKDDIAVLKIWEKLRIIVGEGPEAGVYEARVEDIINGGVVVTNPEFISGRTLLRQDVPVVVQITRKDAAYKFESRIKQEIGTSNKRIILTPPRRLTRIQRRMFARVELPVHLKFAVCKYDMDWANWRNSLEWHTTFAANISGGGMLISTDEGCSKGSAALFEVDLFNQAGLSPFVLGESRRAYLLEGKRYCGIEFMLAEVLEDKLSPTVFGRLPEETKTFNYSNQDRLVTYLFHKQIELRKKGLI